MRLVTALAFLLAIHPPKSQTADILILRDKGLIEPRLKGHSASEQIRGRQQAPPGIAGKHTRVSKCSSVKLLCAGINRQVVLNESFKR